MDYTLGILAGLSFLFLAFAAVGMNSRTAAADRLRTLGGERKKGGYDTVSNIDEGDSWADRLLRVITVLGGGASRDKGKVYENVHHRLMEAGFRRPSALSIYMGSRVAIGGGLAAILIIGSWSLGMTPNVIAIGGAAMIGYLMPGIVVDNLRKKRQESITRGLSDAIDLMVVCTEAGLGLIATLERVAKEFRDNSTVISDEFLITVYETEAGRGLMDALRGLSDRNGNKELSNLINLLIQTDRFGTPMVETLRAQGEAMRIERMLRAEEQAMKAPVKMMFPAMLIFAAVLIILGGPAVILLLATLTAGPTSSPGL